MRTIERRVIETVDRLLLERGRLDALDYLTELGLVRQTHCETHNVDDLVLLSALLVPVDEALALLEQAETYGRAQGLAVVTQAPTTPQLVTTAHADPARRLTELCKHVLRHPDDELRQKDLFHDSAGAAVLHRLRGALAEHDLEGAGEALQRLRALTPAPRAIEDHARLLQALAASSARPADCLRELETEITPLAWRCLGSQARDYLSPLWIGLAGRLTDTAFAPDAPGLHASYAYAQAREWSAAARAVEAEPDWVEHATLVARLAEALARQGQQDPARRHWAALCWRHPDTAASVLVRAPGDPTLARLWGRFLDADTELAVGDFPAWLLLADPRQSSLVPASVAPDTSQGRAYRAMHRVMTADGDIDARIALKALRPDLLELYLARREFHGA